LQLDVSSSFPPCIGPSRTSKIAKTSGEYCTMVQYLAPLRYWDTSVPQRLQKSHSQYCVGVRRKGISHSTAASYVIRMARPTLDTQRKPRKRKDGWRAGYLRAEHHEACVCTVYPESRINQNYGFSRTALQCIGSLSYCYQTFSHQGELEGCSVLKYGTLFQVCSPKNNLVQACLNIYSV
jgi:hypothetical protein